MERPPPRRLRPDFRHGRLRRREERLRVVELATLQQRSICPSCSPAQHGRQADTTGAVNRDYLDLKFSEAVAEAKAVLLLQTPVATWRPAGPPRRLQHCSIEAQGEVDACGEPPDKRQREEGRARRQQCPRRADACRSRRTGPPLARLPALRSSTCCRTPARPSRSAATANHWLKPTPRAAP